MKNEEGKDEKEKTITKESVLKDILELKGAEEILQKHELPCLHCPMAQYELHLLKLGEVCQRYDIDLNKVLEELNKLTEE